MMLLPFALAGVTLYFALRFCIRKFKSMVPDEMNEEPHDGTAGSEDAMGSAVITAKSVKDTAGPLRDGADM